LECGKDRDKIHGEIWGNHLCGHIFCNECFIKVSSEKVYGSFKEWIPNSDIRNVPIKIIKSTTRKPCIVCEFDKDSIDIVVEF
jgi:hypothetical protein